MFYKIVKNPLIKCALKNEIYLWDGIVRSGMALYEVFFKTILTIEYLFSDNTKLNRFYFAKG